MAAEAGTTKANAANAEAKIKFTEAPEVLVIRKPPMRLLGSINILARTIFCAAGHLWSIGMRRTNAIFIARRA